MDHQITSPQIQIQILSTSVAEKALRSAIWVFSWSSSERPMYTSASRPRNTSSLDYDDHSLNLGVLAKTKTSYQELWRGGFAYLKNTPTERPIESTLRNNSWSTAPWRFGWDTFWRALILWIKKRKCFCCVLQCWISCWMVWTSCHWVVFSLAVFRPMRWLLLQGSPDTVLLQVLRKTFGK